MSTKEIKQLAPDHFALYYASQHVGRAWTEAEAKTKLDEIAYDVEHRGLPIPEAPLSIACRLIDQIIAQQTTAAPADPVTIERQSFDDGDGVYTRCQSGDVWLDLEDNGDGTLVFNTVMSLR